MNGRLNNDLTEDCYTLVADKMWLGVKGFQICIYTTDEGVVVDIHKGGDLDAYDESIASTYAFDNECIEYED